MSISSVASIAATSSPAETSSQHIDAAARGEAVGIAGGEEKLREVFGKFVGETFFHQLITSMRTSIGKPAYFHGGRAEEVFQGQLDQMLSEKMAEGSSTQLSQPMFDLFQLQRRA